MKTLYDLLLNLAMLNPGKTAVLLILSWLSLHTMIHGYGLNYDKFKGSIKNLDNLLDSVTILLIILVITMAITSFIKVT